MDHCWAAPPQLVVYWLNQFDREALAGEIPELRRLSQGRAPDNSVPPAPVAAELNQRSRNSEPQGEEAPLQQTARVTPSQALGQGHPSGDGMRANPRYCTVQPPHPE